MLAAVGDLVRNEIKPLIWSAGCLSVSRSRR
jgi:hypothetical protein